MTILNRPALEVIDMFDAPNAVLFCDPPYPGAMGARYRHSMNDDEHEALASRLDRCRADVILTMAPGTVYEEILSGWQCIETGVITNGGSKKPEVILTNFAVAQGVLTDLVREGS